MEGVSEACIRWGEEASGFHRGALTLIPSVLGQGISRGVEKGVARILEDARYLKIVAGLAYECSLVNRVEVEALSRLYEEPSLGGMREMHGRLIDSDNHREREVAIWLEPALELGPIGTPPERLAREMREMEFILLILTRKAGEAWRTVNRWMDYIANAAISLLQGYWIDAKIYLSRALEASRSVEVEALKMQPHLSYEVDILQRATISYFQELRSYPVRLEIPPGSVDPLIEIQGIPLEMMEESYLRRVGGRILRESIHRLSRAIRYLMEEGGGSRAEGEVRRVMADMETAEQEGVERAGSYRVRLEEAAGRIAL